MEKNSASFVMAEEQDQLPGEAQDYETVEARYDIVHATSDSPESLPQAPPGYTSLSQPKVEIEKAEYMQRPSLPLKTSSFNHSQDHKKFVVGVVVVVTVSLLMSCASLAFAFFAFNSKEGETTQGALQQANQSSDSINELLKLAIEVRRLESTLQQFNWTIDLLAAQLSNLELEEAASANTTSYLARSYDDLSSRQSRELDSARESINTLSLQVNSTMLHYSDLNARNRRDIDSALGSISSIRSQVSTTSSSLSSLRNRFVV